MTIREALAAGPTRLERLAALVLIGVGLWHDWSRLALWQQVYAIAAPSAVVAAAAAAWTFEEVRTWITSRSAGSLSTSARK